MGAIFWKTQLPISQKSIRLKRLLRKQNTRAAHALAVVIGDTNIATGHGKALARTQIKGDIPAIIHPKPTV